MSILIGDRIEIIKIIEQYMQQNNILLTGLPRSGSTLICHLLNKVDNVVALHEPMSFNNNEFNSLTDLNEKIIKFYNNTRISLLETNTAISLHIDNEIPDNHIGNNFNKNGLRSQKSGVKKGLVKIGKNLTDSFKLCIKHNALFTLLLEQMMTQFRCYAIIRNPLSLLASWNSVQLPIHNGHIPIAEKYDNKLAIKLNSTPNKIDRQIIILSWFYKHYTILPSDNIIKYEDVIYTNGASLKSVIPEAKFLNESLKNQNTNKLYSHRLMAEMSERLLNSDPDIWTFYSKDDVMNIIDQLNI